MAQHATVTAHGGRGAGRPTAGEEFARAFAAKDRDRLIELLSDGVDFEALTPGRHWVGSSSAEAVEEIMLRHWLRPDDVVLHVDSVTTGQVGDRQRVGYRLAVRRDGVDHALEQQAYYLTQGQRISWIRILCSGYQAAQVA